MKILLQMFRNRKVRPRRTPEEFSPFRKWWCEFRFGNGMHEGGFTRRIKQPDGSIRVEEFCDVCGHIIRTRMLFKHLKRIK